MVVKFPILNHFLNFPRGNLFSKLFLINNSQLPFSPADMFFSDLDYSLFLNRSDFSFSCFLGSFGFVFQTVEAVKIIPVKLSKPLVEGLSGDAKMFGSLSSIVSLTVVNNPLQSQVGSLGQFEYLGYFSKTIVFIQKLDLVIREMLPDVWENQGGIRGFHMDEI